ncbi:MAG TPA: hypothetical protein VK933_05175 [Longimicrobiales bacterium]|nr:hypothetical protein [Longimicrobiales bacterium]
MIKRQVVVVPLIGAISFLIWVAATSLGRYVLRSDLRPSYHELVLGAATPDMAGALLLLTAILSVTLWVRGVRDPREAGSVTRPLFIAAFAVTVGFGAERYGIVNAVLTALFIMALMHGIAVALCMALYDDDRRPAGPQ